MAHSISDATVGPKELKQILGYIIRQSQKDFGRIVLAIVEASAIKQGLGASGLLLFFFFSGGCLEVEVLF